MLVVEEVGLDYPFSEFCSSWNKLFEQVQTDFYLMRDNTDFYLSI